VVVVKSFEDMKEIFSGLEATNFKQKIGAALNPINL
jgi:hypothetical protein